MNVKIDSATEAFMAKYAANVTELRFGPKVKVVKTSRHDDLSGWRVMVEGPVGGHILASDDGFLYRTTGNCGNPMKSKSFIFEDVVDAITHATALADNLGENGQVVDPSRGFISRFLNPDSFDSQMKYWASEDGGEMEVLTR